VNKALNMANIQCRAMRKTANISEKLFWLQQDFWMQPDVRVPAMYLPDGKMFLMATFDKEGIGEATDVLVGWSQIEHDSTRYGFGATVRDNKLWKVTLSAGRGKWGAFLTQTLHDELLPLTKMSHPHVAPFFLDWIRSGSVAWLITREPLATYGTLQCFIIQGRARRALCTKRDLVVLVDILQDVGHYLVDQLKGFNHDLFITAKTVGLRDRGDSPEGTTYKPMIMLNKWALKLPDDKTEPSVARSLAKLLGFIFFKNPEIRSIVLPAQGDCHDMEQFALLCTAIFAILPQDQTIELPISKKKYIATQPLEQVPLHFA
jgi:hypothetical protein